MNARSQPPVTSAIGNEPALTAFYPELSWLDLASGYQRPTAQMNLSLPADQYEENGEDGEGRRRSWGWGFLSFVCGDYSDELASTQHLRPALGQYPSNAENLAPDRINIEIVSGHRRTPAVSHDDEWQGMPLQGQLGAQTRSTAAEGSLIGHRRMPAMTRFTPATVRRLPPKLGPYEIVHYLGCQIMEALESTDPMLRMLGRRRYSDRLRREATLRSSVNRFMLAVAEEGAFEAAAELAMDFREIEWEGVVLTIDDIFDVIDERLGGIVDTSCFSPPIEVVERDATASGTAVYDQDQIEDTEML